MEKGKAFAGRRRGVWVPEFWLLGRKIKKLEICGSLITYSWLLALAPNLSPHIARPNIGLWVNVRKRSLRDEGFHAH